VDFYYRYSASTIDELRVANDLKGSVVTDIFDTELLGFWTLSIVRILIVTRKKKNKHDVSETGSVSVLR
jgi:hypothetical protein